MSSALGGLFAVTGRPVMHSRSPALFNAAFAHLGVEGAYVRLLASSADEVRTAARHLGLRGVNLTAPFKEELSHGLSHASEEVARVNAVNTLRFEREGGVTGYNTDLFGVTATFQEAGLPIKGARAAVLGAGGAARAAVEALRCGHARSVTILNRTRERGQALARQTLSRFAPLDRASLARVLPETDIVVSTLPGSAALGPVPLKPGSLVLEAAYAGESALERAARERGCIVLSGRRWLFYQALAAFQVLVGHRPPVDVMEAALEVVPARPRAVALVGFSCAGKSTLAPLVARLLGSRALDTDQMVAVRAGRAVGSMIRDAGEAAFRAAERDVFESLPDAAGTVVACGGGALVDSANVERLRARGYLVVWLGARLEVCRERIRQSAADRPLVSGRPEDEVAELFERRQLTYARTCDAVLDVEGRDEEAVAAEVVRCFAEARA